MFEGIRETLFTAGRGIALLKGFLLTLALTYTSFLFGTVWAVILCMGKRSRKRFISALANKITVLCGGTPVLVLLMISFYVIFPGGRVNFIAAATALSYAFGCYISDSLTASVNSITEEQWNVAFALGLDRKTAFRKLYFRNVVSTFVPQTIGSALTILHLTSLVGAMSMLDATQVINNIVAEIGRTVFPMIVLVVLYLLASVSVTKFLLFAGKVLSKKKDLLEGVDRSRPVRPYTYEGMKGVKDTEVLKLSGIKKTYGEKHVICGLNGAVKRGSIVSVIGRSGSGKSTLFRLIAGLEKADEGTVNVLAEPGRSRVGIVFPDFCLFEDMTAIENMVIAPLAAGFLLPQEAYDKAMAFLALMGMADRADDPVSILPMGHRKRLSIARALMTDPEILLFDEPTAHLDPISVGEVEFVMKSLADSGMTMLLSTHELPFVREISDEVWFMNNGVIEEAGETEAFFLAPAGDECRKYLKNMEILSGTVSADSADLPGIYSRIAFFCDRNSLDAKTRFSIYRIMEELTVGMICKAVPAGQSVAYEGEYDRKQNAVTVTVRYGGEAWDPFGEEDSLEIMLVRKTVASAEHSYRDGRNRLRLTIKPQGKVIELG